MKKTAVVKKAVKRVVNAVPKKAKKARTVISIVQGLLKRSKNTKYETALRVVGELRPDAIFNRNMWGVYKYRINTLGIVPKR